MKKLTKVSKFMGMCLLMSLLLTPIKAEATSNNVPTWVLDWDENSWLGGIYDEMFFWTNGVEYTNFQFVPYNNSLKLKIDTIDLRGSVTVTCFNSSGTQIGSRICSSGTVQTISFNNLNDSYTYYFRFTGNHISGAGWVYFSENNVF